MKFYRIKINSLANTLQEIYLKTGIHILLLTAFLGQIK